MNITIEKIQIVSFGKLKNTVVSLGEGINVLSAPNESGKSTLAAFIKFVFYGFVGSKKAFPQNERKLFTPWDNETSEGAVTFFADGTRYSVYRKCLPSGKENVDILNRVTGKTEFKGEVPGEVFFGVAEEVFARTLFFRQLSLPENKDEILAERLRNIALGSDEEVGVEKAMRRLNESRKELKTRVGGGIIPKLEYERNRIEQTITDGSDLRREITRLHNEINNRAQIISTGGEKLKKLEQEYKNIDNYEAFLKLQNIKRLEEEVSESENAYRLAEETVGSWTATDVSMLDSKNAEFVIEQRNAKKRFNELETAKSELEYLEQGNGEIKKEVKKSGAWKIFLALGVISAAASVFFVPALALSLVFFVLFGVSLAKSKKKKDEILSVEAERSAFEERKRNAKANVERLERDYQNNLSVCEQIGEDLFQALSEFIDKKQNDYAETIAELKNRFIDIQKKKAVYEAKRDEFSSLSQSTDIGILVEKASNAQKPERDRVIVERELKFYTQQQEQLQAMNRKDEIDCASYEAKTGDIATLVGKKNSLDERINELNIKHKAYETAIQFIEDSADHMKSMIAPRIGNRANEYFSVATDGKYNSFEVDTSLSMSFGDDFRRSCEYLSAGTRDSAYLSLRLALADILFSGNGVPMILDDAFVRMDDDRLGAMMNALSEAANKHQILILTHGDREKNILTQKEIAYNEITM